MAIRRDKRASRVATFLAAASLPRTFQRSLLPRDTTDQGIVTGLTMAIIYAMGVVLEDGIDAVADTVSNASSHQNPEKAQANASLFVSAAALGLGLAAQTILKQQPKERLERSAGRTIGYWLATAGAAGVAVGLLERAPTIFQDETEKPKELPPLVIPLIGALIAISSEHFRPTITERQELQTENEAVSRVRSIGIGLGVAAVIAGISFAEEKTAHAIDSLTGKYAPVLKRQWLPLGHVVALGGLIGGITWFMRHTYRKIEAGADEFETAISHIPSSPLVSGCAESLVPWSSMTIQGRRHIAAQTSATAIETVMNEYAKEPIRLFVGFDSAPTEIERVQLALAELQRTKAYDREVLVVISPTGTGYVNYIFSESVEYLTRGNVASVTIQYSKRPSPLSLDQVPEGRHQYRMLLNGIKRELKKRPIDKRPRIVLFGESLGAWTSQDAFMGSGTDGFEALHIDRALWIGTPAGSKWKEQVLDSDRLDVDRDMIGVFNDYSQVLAMPTLDRSKLRYVMVTHYNDPVARFGTSLLLQAPDWLASDRSKRPSSIPATTRWRTPTTFIQTLVDMKNALKPIPGQFVATGHDYRGDLANFVHAVYDLPASDEQMQNIELALRASEKLQAKILANQKDSDSKDV